MRQGCCWWGPRLSAELGLCCAGAPRGQEPVGGGRLVALGSLERRRKRKVEKPPSAGLGCTRRGKK